MKNVNVVSKKYKEENFSRQWELCCHHCVICSCESQTCDCKDLSLVRCSSMVILID